MPLLYLWSILLAINLPSLHEAFGNNGLQWLSMALWHHPLANRAETDKLVHCSPQQAGVQSLNLYSVQSALH